MTLTEALTALHEAGWIKSPWLPGMLVRQHREEPDPGHAWRKLDLQQGWQGVPQGFAADYIGVPTTGDPDLTDPATVGCLLALLREASGRPDLTTHLHDGYWHTGPDGYEWGGPSAPTEVEAIAVALIALAGAGGERG